VDRWTNMAKVAAACLQVFTINTKNRKKNGDKFYILIKKTVAASQ